jgi:flagellar protein FliO/FliZ
VLELVVRLGISLAVVLGLFWTVARLTARRGGGSRQLMRVRSRQSLSRTASVAVVEVGGRLLVVGVADGGVRLLTELDPEEVPDVLAEPAGATALAGDPAGDPAGDRAGDRAGEPVTAGAPLAGSVLAPATWKQAWAATRTGSGRARA